MKNTKEEEELYVWCLEQTAARYMGQLQQWQIDKLNAINFPWAYYEEQLDKLGFSWQKNSPHYCEEEEESEEHYMHPETYLDRD